jgi:hypothetical protein
VSQIAKYTEEETGSQKVIQHVAQLEGLLSKISQKMESEFAWCGNQIKQINH